MVQMVDMQRIRGYLMRHTMDRMRMLLMHMQHTPMLTITIWRSMEACFGCRSNMDMDQGI